MNAFSKGAALVRETFPSVRANVTRQGILEAARHPFAANGFAQTTIRDIARTADVAVGTVFLHFPDKSALLGAALYEGFEEALVQAVASLQTDWTLRRQLVHLARGLYAYPLQNQALTTVLLKETLFMEGEWGQAFQEQPLCLVNDIAAIFPPPRHAESSPAKPMPP